MLRFWNIPLQKNLEKSLKLLWWALMKLTDGQFNYDYGNGLVCDLLVERYRIMVKAMMVIQTIAKQCWLIITCPCGIFCFLIEFFFEIKFGFCLQRNLLERIEVAIYNDFHTLPFFFTCWNMYISVFWMKLICTRVAWFCKHWYWVLSPVLGL